MKRVMLALPFLALILPATAQTDKPVESKITNVTVFLSKAQVTRKANTRIEAGKTNLLVTGLTSLLDPESIQVTGKGGFTILGISHQQNYLNEFNMPRPLRILKDSIDYYQKQVSLEQSQKEILNKEEQMLLSNQKIGGANQNLTVAELKAMADFYRSRLGEIVNARMKQDEKIKKINERIVRLQAQMNEQNELYGRNTSEIVVSVSAEAATAVDLEVNYVVTKAGWIPVYDLRALDTKNPIQLSYKANVYQGTGEEWKNVKLKLSTANPNLGGLKPELYTWYLDFQVPITYSMQGKAKGEFAMRSTKPAAAGVEVADEEPMLARELSDHVTTIQTSLNTEFDIALPYTVSSSVKPTLVDIRKHEMKAQYNYSVAPKLDRDAFLIAKATGWEEFNLLPGEANIFFEGTFVSKTFIDPNNIKDTLAISLGRDKRIVVKRDKLKDLTSRNLIGSTQKESYTWEISIRNTKTEAVKITVEDQLPVSQNEQIEVTALNTGGANFNKDTGKMIWNWNLQPNETKKVSYQFEVKYPKGKLVTGL